MERNKCAMMGARWDPRDDAIRSNPNDWATNLARTWKLEKPQQNDEHDEGKKEEEESYLENARENKDTR